MSHPLDTCKYSQNQLRYTMVASRKRVFKQIRERTGNESDLVFCFIFKYPSTLSCSNGVDECIKYQKDYFREHCHKL